MITSFETIKNEFAFSDCDAVQRKILALTDSLHGYTNPHDEDRFEKEIRNLFFEAESIDIEFENEGYRRSLESLYSAFLLAVARAKAEKKTYAVMRAFLWQLDIRISLLRRMAV